MISSLLFLSPILLTMIIISATDQEGNLTLPIPADDHHPSHYLCSNDRGNYTMTDSYHTNLNHLLSSLLSKHKGHYGYYTSSYGRNTTSGAIYATGLCKGDIETSRLCLHCLNASRIALVEHCPNQKEAIIWLNNCMLRYSNRSMVGIMETQPAFDMCSRRHEKPPSSKFDMFSQNLTLLFERIRIKAARGGLLQKFAKDNTTIVNYSNDGQSSLTAAVQCTPDLSEKQCSTCLLGAFKELPECCDGEEGGRVLRPSCNFNYQLHHVNEPRATLFPTSRRPGASDSSVGIHLVVYAMIFSVVLMIPVGIYMKVAKRRPRPVLGVQHNFLEKMDEHMAMESLQFNCGTIQVATNNFSEANKLVDDGYDTLYWGNLSDGKSITVRKLSRNYVKEYMEFKKEILSMAKLHHPNLLVLLGCALETNSERLLVYESFPNATLDRIIFDVNQSRQWDWEMRYNIILSIARGLLHLHHHHFVHGDVNMGNILIDAQMNPKISNFGMASFFAVDQTQGNFNGIHPLNPISNLCMAPEASIGHSSAESDVYSFGALVVEIVSGERITCLPSRKLNEKDLLIFAWKNWAKGTVRNLIDPTLWSGSGIELMERCIRIGLLCMQRIRSDRPTMSSVIQMLTCSSAVPLPYKSRHDSLGIIRTMENEEGVSDPRTRVRVQSLFAKMRCATTAIINRMRSK